MSETRKDLSSEERDNQVLLIKEPGKQTPQVASAMDEQGNLTTVPFHNTKQDSFMHFHKGSNALESFISNFMDQVKNPSGIQYYLFPAELLDKQFTNLKNMFKGTGEVVDDIREVLVESMQEAWKQEEKPEEKPAKNEKVRNDGPYDASLIDLEVLHRYGIPLEKLAEDGQLDNMLQRRRTDRTYEINRPLASTNQKIEAQLYFTPETDSKGEVTRLVLGYEPALKKVPYEDGLLGYTFTKEDKENLDHDGNLGHIVGLKNSNGQIEPCFVSVNPVTKQFRWCPVKKMTFQKEIGSGKGKQVFTDEEMAILKTGGKVKSRNLKNKEGKPYDCYFQADAMYKRIGYVFENNGQFKAKKLYNVEVTPQQAARLNNNQSILLENIPFGKNSFQDRYVKWNTEYGYPQLFTYDPDTPADNRKIIIPKEIGNVALDYEQMSVLEDGGYTYVKDMDFGNGPFSRYVRMNMETGQVHMAKNPDEFDMTPRVFVFDTYLQRKLTAKEKGALQDGLPVKLDNLRGNVGLFTQWAIFDKKVGHVVLSNKQPGLKESKDQEVRQATRNQQIRTPKTGAGIRH